MTGRQVCSHCLNLASDAAPAPYSQWYVSQEPKLLSKDNKDIPIMKSLEITLLSPTRSKLNYFVSGMIK